MTCICLFPQFLDGKVCGAEYHQANDPETEIWRACQRSITAEVGAELHFADEWLPRAPQCMFLRGLTKY